MPTKKLKDFLDKNNVKYVSITHSTAYTAQEVAASAHIKGQNMAKTVMVKYDSKMAMAVVPAHYRVNLEKLGRELTVSNVELASEKEFSDRFFDCEEGAMPPFGNLYDLPVYVDASLTEDEQIAFNAGSYSELVQLAYRDFERLVQPQVLDFAEPTD